MTETARSADTEPEPMGRYDDILYRSPPPSVGRSRMKREDRAKQFSPFAALKGYEEAIQAQERQFSPPKQLSETRKAELDRILLQVKEGDLLTVEFYRHGRYETLHQPLVRLDRAARQLIFEEESVSIDTIYDLRAEGIFLPDEGC